MSNNNSFELLTKTPMIKKVIIAFIAILILSTNGISSMVSAIPDYLDKGLNPIPYSPPMPESVKRMNERKVKIEKGTRTIIDGATRYVSPDKQFNKDSNYSPNRINMTLNTVRARLNAFAASRYYLQNGGGQIITEGTGFMLQKDIGNNTSTHSLVMYPQIRDIIPPDATITESVLITDHYESGLLFDLEAKEILSTWDPRQTLVSLPTLGASLGTASLDLSSTLKDSRVYNVTSVIQSWFSNTSPQWGV